jgi:hypothetical protein
MSLPDALAAFAEPPTTTVTILEIKTDTLLDSDVWGLRHPSGHSIHPSRNKPWSRLTVSAFLNELISKRFNGFLIKGAILTNHQQNVQTPIVEQKTTSAIYRKSPP